MQEALERAADARISAMRLIEQADAASRHLSSLGEAGEGLRQDEVGAVRERWSRATAASSLAMHHSLSAGPCAAHVPKAILDAFGCSIQVSICTDVRPWNSEPSHRESCASCLRSACYMSQCCLAC
jgi:hypothetical protein